MGKTKRNKTEKTTVVRVPVSIAHIIKHEKTLAKERIKDKIQAKLRKHKK